LRTFSFVAEASNFWNPSGVMVITGDGVAPKLRGDHA
jgi:hypothetical protein